MPASVLAGADAGRVEAEETAADFHQRLLVGVGRRDVGESGRDFRTLSDFGLSAWRIRKAVHEGEVEAPARALALAASF
jgi:hypothetical protein